MRTLHSTIAAMLAASVACVFFSSTALFADAVPLSATGPTLEAAALSDRTLCLTLWPSNEPAAKTPAAPVFLLPYETSGRKTWSSSETARTLEIGSWRVRVQNAPLTIRVENQGGRLVQSIALDDQTGALSFRLGEGPVLGLGEGGKQFDRRGGFYPMQPAWGSGALGSTVPSPLVIGTDGWALFIPQPHGQFDLRAREGRFLPSPAECGQPLRVFVITWKQPVDVCAEYIRLTGQPVMPPKWALGYMQSHRTLAGPEEVLEVARTFREKKLPCDALIYLGTGYCPAGWNRGHGSLEFNPKTFDRPAENLRQLHDLNFKVVLHVNHAPRGMFGTTWNETSDSPDYVRNYWSGHRAALALGVDGWWPDDGDELPEAARFSRHYVYYAGSLTDRPDVRPWSLHRTGTPGVARFGGWIWSGDIDSRWDTLAAQVSVGLNHSLSLTPFWGTDTGGFYPKKELTGELYVRWFQFSAFCPLFRSHGRTWHLRLPWGWNTGEFGPLEDKETPEAAELHNPNIEPICRDYLNLRYRLLPYIYTLAREAHDTGMPLMRALWLHYPEDPQAVKEGREYLWGRNILVAPVVEKGAKSREIYLPKGDWFDWWTGEKLAGARQVTRSVDLATLPLFVRAGAIIPLDPVRQFVSEKVNEPTTLQVYSGSDGQFTLYDDDGSTLAYQRGQGTWTKVTWRDADRRLIVEPGSEGSSSPQAWRTFKVQLLPGTSSKTVEYTGQRMEVSF